MDGGAAPAFLWGHLEIIPWPGDLEANWASGKNWLYRPTIPATGLLALA